MNGIIRFLLILAVCMLVYVLLNKVMQNYIQNLSSILYKDADAKKYIEKLNNWVGKLFFSKTTRSLMSIDALLMLNDREKIEEIFERLDGSRMNPGNRMGLAQKEISYYVDTHQNEKALKAYSNLEAIAGKFKNPQVENVLKECTYQIEIYINHNTDLLDEMLDVASKMSNPFYEGVFLYRAAKLYYYKHDEASCRKTLEKALTKLKGTAWENLINRMLKEDLSLIAIK